MKIYWKKKSQEEIKSIVFEALEQNINYDEQNVLGVPASYLDDKVFNQDVSFIKDAPLIWRKQGPCIEKKPCIFCTAANALVMTFPPIGSMRRFTSCSG